MIFQYGDTTTMPLITATKNFAGTFAVGTGRSALRYPSETCEIYLSHTNSGERVRILNRGGTASYNYDISNVFLSADRNPYLDPSEDYGTEHLPRLFWDEAEWVDWNTLVCPKPLVDMILWLCGTSPHLDMATTHFVLVHWWDTLKLRFWWTDTTAKGWISNTEWEKHISKFNKKLNHWWLETSEDLKNIWRGLSLHDIIILI